MNAAGVYVGSKQLQATSLASALKKAEGGANASECR
jgi:hypothetical protein